MSTNRAYNFGAGPAMLPNAVVDRIRDEMGDWHGTGMSAMEMSHRGPEFTSIAEKAEADLRELMAIPADYKVLFLQGGATSQFAAIPLNICQPEDRADFLVSGYWSRKAAKESARFCRANIAMDTGPDGDRNIPGAEHWKLSDDAAFVHFADNETIGGVRFPFLPKCTAPRISDMSSSILSGPVDVGDYGIIYAGAQKNIGPAGLTIVIIRDDLLGRQRKGVPTVMDYQKMAAAGSMLNTPPTFAWYAAGLVFEWLKEQGGLERMASRNQAKAELLYQAIDSSDFYSNPVDVGCRSLMNVPFILADASLDRQFLQQADDNGLKSLKGHRSIGGLRASIYNAIPYEGVDALVQFMSEFERVNG